MADQLLKPDEIEALLRSAGAGTPQPAAAPAAPPQAAKPAPPPPRAAAAPKRSAPASSTERLLDQAEAGLAAAISPNGGQQAGGATPFEFEAFDHPSTNTPRDGVGLHALQDVELDLRIELGRTELLIEEVLKLTEGSVVPLNKLAGDPVDILVNGRLIARGEVLVLNDNFCVRVAEIVAPTL